MITLFDQLVKKKTKKSGRVAIDCPKGLWGVDAPCLLQAEREAMAYFGQYLADGEYDDLIKD